MDAFRDDEFNYKDTRVSGQLDPSESNVSIRKGRADNYRKGTRKLRARVQLQDTRQRDRSKNNHL